MKFDSYTPSLLLSPLNSKRLPPLLQQGHQSNSSAYLSSIRNHIFPFLIMLPRYSITKPLFRKLFHPARFIYFFHRLTAERKSQVCRSQPSSLFLPDESPLHYQFPPSSSSLQLTPPRPPHRFRKSRSIRAPISAICSFFIPTQSSKY